MSAAFTKGPWFASPYSSVVGPGIVGPGGRVIASIAVAPGFNPVGPHEAKREIEYADEVRANARLIAAAPSLYADAEFLCARIRELEGEMTDDDDLSRQYFGHVLPAVARMESALAEVRGEQ